MATLFAIAVSIVIAGFLWFYIARPILEDYGVIKKEESVSDYHPVAQPAPTARAPDQPSTAASSQRVEPPEITETHQPEPKDPPSNDPAFDPIIVSHKMTRKELTIVLAVQKDSDGAYRFSANSIAQFVGGASAETKGWVAEVRGKKESAPNTVRRPANGWGRAF